MIVTRITNGLLIKRKGKKFTCDPTIDSFFLDGIKNYGETLMIENT